MEVITKWLKPSDSRHWGETLASAAWPRFAAVRESGCGGGSRHTSRRRVVHLIGDREVSLGDRIQELVPRQSEAEQGIHAQKDRVGSWDIEKVACRRLSDPAGRNVSEA
jgi:hypothetical protein